MDAHKAVANHQAQQMASILCCRSTMPGLRRQQMAAALPPSRLMSMGVPPCFLSLLPCRRASYNRFLLVCH